MFELAVAWKYLVPRRRQLSVSIISLVSICVIALVVWLMLLFFSITSGVERHWISKLVAVAAPVRITPTADYYNSYYHQVDLISAASGYRHKSLTEKRSGFNGDPYDPLYDSEVPTSFAAPNLAEDGQLRDLVGGTFSLSKRSPHILKDFAPRNTKLPLLISDCASHGLSPFRFSIKPC